MMQQRLLDQYSPVVTGRSTELYMSSMKSEVEVSRLGTAIAGMRIFPSQSNYVALGEALDIMFSRHRLAELSFSAVQMSQKNLMNSTLAQIERVLAQLDEDLAIDALDLEDAWRSQAELAVLFNEVTRLALEHQGRVRRDIQRDTERFSQTCSSLIILSLASVVVGCLLLASLLLARIKREFVGEHELV